MQLWIYSQKSINLANQINDYEKIILLMLFCKLFVGTQGNLKAIANIFTNFVFEVNH